MESLTPYPSVCRYIYNKAACARCKTPVRVWDMAARTCYACEACQPPPDLALLAPPRQKALGGAKANKKVGRLWLPLLGAEAQSSIPVLDGAAGA